MDTQQVKEIIAKVENVYALGDGTHKVLFMLDHEMTANPGQYIMISYEKEGLSFEHKHVLGNSYLHAKEIEENIDFQKLEDQSFLSVLKKDEVFTIAGPYNFTFSETASRLLMSGVNHKMLLVESLVIVLIAGSTIFFLIKNVGYQEKVSAPAVAEVFVPKKTDYGTTTPPGFSSSTPIEKGATLSQSYTKDYKSGQQSSIVVPSKKTVLENVVIYEKFLNGDNWKIIKILKNEEKSVISAERAGDLFDVIIIKNKATSTQAMTKSYVLVSTFKK